MELRRPVPQMPRRLRRNQAPMPPQPRHLRPGSGASCVPPGPSVTRRATRSSSSASARVGAGRCTPASPAPRPIRSIAPPTRRACISMPIAPTCPTCCARTMPGRTACRSPIPQLSRRWGTPRTSATPRAATSSPAAATWSMPGSMRAAPSRKSSTLFPRRTTAIRPTTPAGCCPTITR